MTSPLGGVADAPVATLPATYDPANAAVNSTGGASSTPMLDPQAFLQLLVAQLKYQDPSNPVDTSKFMQQTAMLSQVQTMNSMSTTLQSLVTAQQTQSATSMVGKAISFVGPGGEQTSGIVDGVSFQGGAPMLVVGDLAVPVAGVLEIADPVAVPAPTPDDGDTTATDGPGSTGSSNATDISNATDSSNSTDSSKSTDSSNSTDSTPTASTAA